MPGIFICYRRVPAAQDVAGRLAESLVREFGADEVFMDVDSVAAGEDWMEAIEDALQRCDVFIALIHPDWHSDERLWDAEDVLSLEIQSALSRNLLVIPVLVNDAVAPRASDLPESLRTLARRHALSLRHATWRSDLAPLEERIRGLERRHAGGERSTAAPERSRQSSAAKGEPERGQVQKGVSGAVVAHRWEWRIFGSRLSPGDEVLRGLTPVADPQETEEVYLLGPGEEVNVKIRFDLLDVKRLIEVDDDGLQLWAPVSKSEFPLPVADARAVFDTLEVVPPPAMRDGYDVERFLDELASPHPDVEVVHVRKRRVRYSVQGSMAELTSVVANGRETKTIAAESEDPASVLAAVESLGLSWHENTSYNRGLRCLLGGSPVRFAVIDVGTNSVKFHIAEQGTDGSWSRLVDRAAVTRLGEGLDETGDIQPKPLQRTIDAVSAMAAEARANDVLVIAAVGTAALRLASNTSSVIDRFRDEAGIRVEVVSGEEESRLAYLAVVAGVGVAGGSVVVFDTGGGSTQLTFGEGGEVDERFSVNVGAVKYAERFALDGTVDEATIVEARRALDEDLERLDGRDPPEALVGMGGAMTNITAVSLGLEPYDPDVVQGATISADEIERQISMFSSMDVDERRGTVGLQANRAPVILAGALIASAVMDKLGMTSVVVSDRGLRHGLIRERFGWF